MIVRYVVLRDPSEEETFKQYASDKRFLISALKDDQGDRVFKLAFNDEADLRVFLCDNNITKFTRYEG